jgi:hypothetical protein
VALPITSRFAKAVYRIFAGIFVKWFTGRSGVHSFWSIMRP